MFEQGSFPSHDCAVPALVPLPASLARCSVTCLVGGSSPLKMHFWAQRPACLVQPFCASSPEQQKYHFPEPWLYQQGPILFLLVTMEVLAEHRTWEASPASLGQCQRKRNPFFTCACMYLRLKSELMKVRLKHGVLPRQLFVSYFFS